MFAQADYRRESLEDGIMLSQNPKVARLAKLTQDLQQSRNPDQTLHALQAGLADDGEILTSMFLSTRGLAPGEYQVIRMHLRDKRQNELEQQIRDRSRKRCGGVIGAIVSHGQPQLLDDVDWSADPQFREVLQGYWSIIAVPFVSDHLPMNWVLLLRKAPQQFTVVDVENALERVALSTALLENQMLAADLRRANERIDSEARQVGELQRALLPASLPQIAGLEVATSYEPRGRAGGDLYDFFELDRGRWCLFIGDAAGHGLAAAVVMAIVQAVLHAHPDRVAGPATLLTHANRQLCNKQIGGFFTAFLGVYEPVSHRLTYANAGHPPPLLKRAVDGSIAALDAVHSYPLGIDDTETFEESNIELSQSDSVVLYTDGITETRSSTGEMFSQDKLMRAFGDGRHGPAEVIDRLRAAARAHQQDKPATDDQTLVAALVL
jgi:serine phosphatase RsbU (regulator of sigma subunit)